MMDPISVLSAISTTLGILDKFTNLVKKHQGKDVTEHAVQSEKDGEYLKIRHDGQVSENIHVSQFNMSNWDAKRYDALKKKIDIHWSKFNAIDGKIPLASIDEEARLNANMEVIRQDLCKDFRELVALHENTLGVALGAHYSLYEVCGDCA